MASKKPPELNPTQKLEKFLKDNNLGIQIQPQKIRRMEDGGLVIDPPTIAVGVVKPTNGDNKIETQ